MGWGDGVEAGGWWGYTRTGGDTDDGEGLGTGGGVGLPGSREGTGAPLCFFCRGRAPVGAWHGLGGDRVRGGGIAFEPFVTYPKLNRMLDE